MSLDWLPRDNKLKNHDLFEGVEFGGKPPCTMYEKKPVVDPQGNVVEGLYTVCITLNNPAQFNSYTTQMVKQNVAAFTRASMDRSVVATIFTGVGDRAFCTGGNVKEYAEYYAKRQREYQDYMSLFARQIDAILASNTPVICRANGMRLAGGQELGLSCDFTVASDLATFGQIGTRHGSTPDGGSTDFLPWALTMENAMWQCVSNEQWSAYKMFIKGLITKVVPVKKKDGKWIRNPLVITDRYIDDGEVVYGEFKTGKEADEARARLKELPTDFELLDKAVNDIVWMFANLYPSCLMKSIHTIRQKKKYFWELNKGGNLYWLGANMLGEAFLGMTAFNSADITGKKDIDVVKYRQLVAEGAPIDDRLAEAVLPKPKKK
jgi:6-oxo-cyclohex-1-ene-carbonyl-CoA hydrolase